MSGQFFVGGMGISQPNTTGGTGIVTSVGATSPLQSSGGANPVISIIAGTAGDTIYRTVGGGWALQGIGTTGQVYTVAGGIPVWADLPASGVTTGTAPLQVVGDTVSIINGTTLGEILTWSVGSAAWVIASYANTILLEAPLIWESTGSGNKLRIKYPVAIPGTGGGSLLWYNEATDAWEYVVPGLAANGYILATQGQNNGPPLFVQPMSGIIVDTAAPTIKFGFPSQATGDITYFDGSVWTRRAIGNNGDVLQIAGGLPSWVAPIYPVTSVTGTLPITVTPTGSVYDVSWGFAGQATGDTIYFDGTDWQLIAPGADGDVFEIVSGIPAWVAPSGGGFVTSVTASGILRTTGTATAPDVSMVNGTNAGDIPIWDGSVWTIGPFSGLLTPVGSDIYGTYPDQIFVETLTGTTGTGRVLVPTTSYIAFSPTVALFGALRFEGDQKLTWSTSSIDTRALYVDTTQNLFLGDDTTSTVTISANTSISLRGWWVFTSAQADAYTPLHFKGSYEATTGQIQINGDGVIVWGTGGGDRNGLRMTSLGNNLFLGDYLNSGNRYYTGGDHDFECGSGNTVFSMSATLNVSIKDLKIDSTAHLLIPTGTTGSGVEATAGNIRFGAGASAYWNSATNTGTDIRLFQLDSSDNIIVGDGGNAGTLTLNATTDIHLATANTTRLLLTNTLATSSIPLAFGNNAATAGELRFQNNDEVHWRDAAGTGELIVLRADGSNAIHLGDSTSLTNSITRVAAGLVSGNSEVQIAPSLTTWQFTNTQSFARTSLAFIVASLNPAASGTIRFGVGDSLIYRNNAGTVDLEAVFCDPTDTLFLGATSVGNLGGTVLRSGGGSLKFAPNVIQTWELISSLSSTTVPIAFDAIPATAGTIRFSSGSSIYSRNSGNTADASLLTLGVGDFLQLGDLLNVANIELRALTQITPFAPIVGDGVSSAYSVHGVIDIDLAGSASVTVNAADSSNTMFNFSNLNALGTTVTFSCTPSARAWKLVRNPSAVAVLTAQFSTGTSVAVPSLSTCIVWGDGTNANVMRIA